MDLKRLKSFVAVAEQGTVSKAADLLRITQPALSRQIGALEQEIGFKLFARAGRRLALTARGEQLLGDCRSLLLHAGTVSERAQSLRRGDLRVLRIAASALTIEGTFPTFLHHYAESHPDVQLSLIEADASDHFDLLERGEAHLSINVINIIQVDQDRFGSYLLPKFHIQAACASSLNLGGANGIEIRALLQHPLLLPAQVLCDPATVRRRLPAHRGAATRLRRKRDCARLAGACGGRSRRRDHPVDLAARPRPAAGPARHPPERAPSH